MRDNFEGIKPFKLHKDNELDILVFFLRKTKKYNQRLINANYPTPSKENSTSIVTGWEVRKRRGSTREFVSNKSVKSYLANNVILTYSYIFYLASVKFILQLQLFSSKCNLTFCHCNFYFVNVTAYWEWKCLLVVSLRFCQFTEHYLSCCRRGT